MIEYARIEGDRVTLERDARRRGRTSCRAAAKRAPGSDCWRRDASWVTRRWRWRRRWGTIRSDVARRPHVAILSTGDEVVDVSGDAGAARRFATATAWRWRRWCALAGGVPVPLGNAPDEKGELRQTDRAWPGR